MIFLIFGVWALAWAVTLVFAPLLWPVTLACFLQNIAVTFVSRGRNSGSLPYHFVASIFSNGIYVVIFAFSIDILSNARESVVLFLIIYTMSTVPGSLFAHWLAKRFEKGKAKNAQEDRVAVIEAELKEVRTEMERLRGWREHELASVRRTMGWEPADEDEDDEDYYDEEDE